MHFFASRFHYKNARWIDVHCRQKPGHSVAASSRCFLTVASG